MSQPGGSPFTEPAPPGGGGKAPGPRDLLGCLVAYSPKVFTPAGAPGNTTGYGKDDPRDRVTADLVILQAPQGFVLFGGTHERAPKPNTHRVAAPARFSGVWVSHENIVRALAPGGQPLVGAMLLGRLVESEVGNRPINLMSVKGTPDEALAIEIWSKLQMGAIPWNEPVELNPAPMPPAGSVNYGPPPAQPQQITPQQAIQNAQSYGPPQTYAPPPAAPQGYGPVPIPPPPPNWDPAVWNGLNDAQRQQVLASQAPAQQQYAPQAPQQYAPQNANPW